MAALADILPLSRLKAELRLDLDDSSQDSMLAAQAEAALREVGQRAGIALLDVTETRKPPVYASSGGKFIMYDWLPSPKSVTTAYWLDREFSRTDIDLSGGFVFTPVRINSFGSGRYAIRPPRAAQWPDWPGDSVRSIYIEILCGMTAEKAPPSLISAAVLLARDLYNGMASDYTNRAVTRIIKSFV